MSFIIVPCISAERLIISDCSEQMALEILGLWVIMYERIQILWLAAG